GAEHLVPDLAGGLLDGAGAGDHRATREAADAVWRALRVAAMNRDVAGVQPQQRGSQLRECRLRALPERRDARRDGGAPGPIHAQRHALVGAEARAGAAEERGGRIAGELHIARHADADVASLLPPLLLPRADRLVAHARERQLQAARVVAAVVRGAADVFERKLVGAQEVAAAEVGGILA